MPAEMNLFFGNAAWMGLLGLALIPIIAHLVARRRPQAREFPSLLFLKRVMRKTARYRKPQDWALLALRTLAVLALVTAFLHPLLTNREAGDEAGGEKAVVLVVDVSASMAATGADGRRFDIAREQAIALLKQLKPTRANVIWIGAQAEAVFPEPGPNLDFLEQELNQASPRPEPGAIRAALRLAADQVAGLSGEKEIFILSDFQANAWQDQALPSGVPVKTIACGDDVPSNLAITELSVSPAEPVVGEPVEVQCEVTNFSKEPRSVPVVIEIGGSREARDLTLEPGSQGMVILQTKLSQAGNFAVKAELGGDDFIGDNVRRAVLRTLPARNLRVILPMPDAEVPEALRGIARALPWLELKVNSVGELSEAQIVETDYLMLLDWQGRRAEMVEKFAAEGVTVLISPQEGIEVNVLTELLGMDGQKGKLVAETTRGKAWPLGCVNLEAEVYDLFRSGEFGAPLNGEVKSRLSIPKAWGAAGGVTSLVEYADGVPALLVRRDGGRCVGVWGIPLTSDQSSLSAQASFVPFFGEFLKTYRRRSAMGRTEGLPGFPLSWKVPDETEFNLVALRERSSGDELPLVLAAGDGGNEMMSEVAMKPGAYEWSVSNQVLDTMVVNFPSSESDLQGMPADQLAGGESIAPREVSAYMALREGRPLWPWCLLVVVLCLVAESFVAGLRQASKSQLELAR